MVQQEEICFDELKLLQKMFSSLIPTFERQKIAISYPRVMICLHLILCLEWHFQHCKTYFLCYDWKIKKDKSFLQLEKCVRNAVKSNWSNRDKNSKYLFPNLDYFSRLKLQLHFRSKSLVAFLIDRNEFSFTNWGDKVNEVVVKNSLAVVVVQLYLLLRKY